VETPGPFAPRFQVANVEVTEEEWDEELRESFTNSGLFPGVLSESPKGLVSLNFAHHACIHLGTHVEAQRTASPPTRVTYPAQPDRLYTFLLMEVETGTLHWMVINIPGSRLTSGQTVAAYQPPSTGPATSSTSRRYVAVALLQSGAIMSQFSYALCSPERTGFDLAATMADMMVESIAAANFFQVDQDQNFAREFCRNSSL